VDKPKDWTSHDVINFVRKNFNIKKAGHCGTLDPEATGLLVVLIGRATKLSQSLMSSDKIYCGTILLGTETDSADMDGKIISQKDYSHVSLSQIEKLFEKYIGSQKQIPPMFSASQKDGQRLYKLARRGIEVEREAKDIIIKSLRIEKARLPYIDFYLECSKGTYVRVLSSDIGRELGCGAVLYSLRRLASGDFNVENSFTIETMRKWSQEDLFGALIQKSG
jgi:tRNA pseudouridine55 synthase